MFITWNRTTKRTKTYVYFVLRHSVLGCPPQNMGVSYTFFHSVPNSFPVFVVFDSKRKSVRGADLLSYPSFGSFLALLSYWERKSVKSSFPLQRSFLTTLSCGFFSPQLHIRPKTCTKDPSYHPELNWIWPDQASTQQIETGTWLEVIGYDLWLVRRARN